MSRILYLPNSYSQQRQHEKKANIYPVRMAMEAEWYRRNGWDVIWNDWSMLHKVVYTKGDRVRRSPENLPFLTLPRPDRVFTRAKEYTSGNYKYLPGTHIMAASGCWWGKCNFCVENNQPYEVRPVEDVISEIEECKSLGFKEVFDDSATFPTGDWLSGFIRRIRKERNLVLGCNCRIYDYPFVDMERAGFRMLLFGIESANQRTLDRINKGVKVEDIIPTIKKASEAGIEPHIAVMFGYPWESDKDSINTLRLVHFLLKKGYAKTAQASLYSPKGVPGNQAHKKYIKKIYEAAYCPEFWYHKIKEIKTMEDFRYVLRGIKAALC
jgi:radical SAM superfamily enzyme YgiQ (UPF0313 family)